MAKILLLGSYAESLINFRGKLLEEMVADGHTVLACAPDISESVREKLLRLKVDVQEVRMQRTGVSPLYDFVAFWDLVRIIRKFSPDYFLAYTIKPVVYGSLAARVTGVPNIFSMITGLGNAFGSGHGRHRIVSNIAKYLYRMSLRQNKRVFFQNPDDQQFFQELGYLRGDSQSVLINGSGIDINDFSPAPFPPDISFLLIARLIADKGIREYALAAQMLKKIYPDVRFRLVGPFDTNPTALKRKEVDDWVSEGSIEYLGELDDVRGAITDSSVYVLPSYYREGTPRTILEAMAMGRAIITTDSPGCRETVRDGKNGLLIAIKDPVALMKAMEYFIIHPEMLSNHGKESRKIAMEKYDVRKVNETIIEAMGLVK